MDPYKYETMSEVTGGRLERPEVIEKAIKAYKDKLRHSKNPMEQRQIRSRLGSLERDLKRSKELYKEDSNNATK